MKIRRSQEHFQGHYHRSQDPPFSLRPPGPKAQRLKRAFTCGQLWKALLLNSSFGCAGRGAVLCLIRTTAPATGPGSTRLVWSSSGYREDTEDNAALESSLAASLNLPLPGKRPVKYSLFFMVIVLCTCDASIRNARGEIRKWTTTPINPT